MNRQVKRVAAERAVAYRGIFVSKPLPAAGEEVQILVDDERGMVAELTGSRCSQRTCSGTLILKLGADADRG